MFGVNMPQEKPFILNGKTYKSRLLVGTGKYANNKIMKDALEASGTEIVTVALGRVDFNAPKGESILDNIDRSKYTVLPNTAGAYSAQEAIRIARLARSAGFEMVKLEVLSDPKTLLPDPVGTYEATKILIDEGFNLMVYTSDDPAMANKLADLGVASVMPAGAPIGSGQGILNRNNLQIILETVTKCPVLVDAGVGTASDVSIAMEMGFDAVLLNTGVAKAEDPVKMARAMRLACEAGRLAYLSGRIPKKLYAAASSPQGGLHA